MKSLVSPLLVSVLVLCGAAGCSDTDSGSPPVPNVCGEATEGPREGECAPAPQYTEDVSTCQPQATDYQPRRNNSADDTWPACISDDNAYHRIQESISTIARVAAFEEMAPLLWDSQCTPTQDAFVQARVLYAQDQGLDSRMQRREDVHYPVPDGGAKCSEAGVPAENPDRCVGPAKLLPILNDAFARGSEGQKPWVQARRIEASLLWFLYVSVLSEITSCGEKPQDCDSAWAYYTGGTERGAPLGLSRYLKALGEETHQRAYDAALGVRCWRNLDNETGVAQNPALQLQVREQMDRALLRGMALVVRQKLEEVRCSSGEAREGRLAFLQVLVPLMDRAARERNAALADQLQLHGLAADPTEEDLDQAVAALDGLFSCP